MKINACGRNNLNKMIPWSPKGKTFRLSPKPQNPPGFRKSFRKE
jgi:hypothetical protein